ncbi:aldo/keto reductase [Rhodococcus sp. ACT016]|uniref:aldo/keto reductase n=1 Tax=Rhodococcus sp. ACT016 TaxID=3134808 RepID=UPI003D27E2D8
MTLDHYITLGRSGLRVSPFSLGTMTFGEDLGWGSTAEESTAIIDRYLELGGNFLDTANGYTKGHSEKIIGDHLGHDKAKRDRVVIATKFSSNLFPGDPNAGGSNRKAILGQVEESLRRLRTDYIDLYWLHNWDKHTPIEETMSALDTLVRDGKVRYLGISDTPAWKTAQAQLIAQFRGWEPITAIQIEYNLTERTSEGELIPMAHELGIGVAPWSPLDGGLLTGKYTREDREPADSKRAPIVSAALTDTKLDIIDVLVRIADETSATPAQIALAWVQGRPGVGSTIIGARTLEQLEENVAALEVTLTDAQRAELDEVSTPILPFPLPFLAGTPGLHFPDATVNGITGGHHPFIPRDHSDHY